MTQRPAQPGRRQVLACLGLLPWSRPPAAAPATAPAQPAPATAAMSLDFRGLAHLHRWSRGTQHEFTPADDGDLQAWRDMLTLNVHPAVTEGEALADLANRVLGNYQRHGRVLHTRSTPRTPARPAEHFIAAVLGTPQFLEAAFARCALVQGQGLVLVAAHRLYGQKLGPAMSDWLQANGTPHEQALMAWTAWPALERLAQLPQAPQASLAPRKV